MGYPAEIIPQSGFKLSINIDDLLLAQSDIVLSRRIDKDVSECDYFGGKIMVESEDIVDDYMDLSLNLLGGLFENEKHLRYRQLKPGTNDWDGKDVDLEKYSTCFEIKQHCFPIYLKALDLHNQKFPYKRSIGRQKEFNDIQKNIVDRTLDVFHGEDDYTFEGTVKIVHSPTMLNYWHIEVKGIPEDSKGKPLEKSKSTWQKNFFRAIGEDLILVKYTTECKAIAKIKEEFFK